jgi:predicted transcriptional regulator with HTH domain
MNSKDKGRERGVMLGGINVIKVNTIKILKINEINHKVGISQR